MKNMPQWHSDRLDFLLNHQNLYVSHFLLRSRRTFDDFTIHINGNDIEFVNSADLTFIDRPTGLNHIVVAVGRVFAMLHSLWSAIDSHLSLYECYWLKVISHHHSCMGVNVFNWDSNDQRKLSAACNNSSWLIIKKKVVRVT